MRRVATFGIFVCVAVAVNETQSQFEFQSESEILSIAESVCFEGFQVDGKCREVSECRLSHMRENSKDFLKLNESCSITLDMAEDNGTIKSSISKKPFENDITKAVSRRRRRR